VDPETRVTIKWTVRLGLITRRSEVQILPRHLASRSQKVGERVDSSPGMLGPSTECRDFGVSRLG
jgi:hypothetical protein